VTIRKPVFLWAAIYTHSDAAQTSTTTQLYDEFVPEFVFVFQTPTA